MHIWNPIGYPALGQDEGHYMRRAMNVLEGESPQEGLNPEELKFRGESRYDHPYFGQLFLASVFKLIGFPDIVQPSLGDRHSIEMLYTIPRILMGLLAVVDTFLVFKIAERLYNRNIGLIASVLFAVMPITWLLRLILLDSILLPFLLASILFAVYTKDATIKNQYRKSILLTLFSGIFLGLAIFTKVPVFTMIPLVSFLVYSNSNIEAKSEAKNSNNKRNWGRIGLWFIPVILISAIWPAYAISLGEFDKWVDGVSHQATERGDAGKSLFVTTSIIFEIDPLFTVLSVFALIYAAVKRNVILLLWFIPIMAFFFITGFVSQFHLSPIFPAYCIAIGLLIVDLSKKILVKKVTLQRVFPVAALSLIAIYGLAMSVMLITTNVGAFHFDSATLVSNYAKDNKDDITIITGPYFSWVFNHVFDIDRVFEKHRPLEQSDMSDKIIMMSNFKKDEFKLFLTNAEKKVLGFGNVDENNVTRYSKLSNIIDSDSDTNWISNDMNSWILIDLGSEKRVCQVNVDWFTSYGQPRKFTFSVSPDGDGFAQAFSGDIPLVGSGEKIYNLTNNPTSRFIRINYDENIGGSYLTIKNINAFTRTADNQTGFNQTGFSCEEELPFKTVADSTTNDPSNKYEHTIPPSLPIFKFLNNSTIVGSFVGEKVKYDTSIYPYNNLDFNSGGGRVDIRSNFNSSGGIGH
jgi:Dolichyl-phosphate-mannose-protein mannosyltransferase/F5/8 type C domain